MSDSESTVDVVETKKGEKKKLSDARLLQLAKAREAAAAAQRKKKQTNEAIKENVKLTRDREVAQLLEANRKLKSELQPAPPPPAPVQEEEEEDETPVVVKTKKKKKKPVVVVEESSSSSEDGGGGQVFYIKRKKTKYDRVEQPQPAVERRQPLKEIRMDTNRRPPNPFYNRFGM
jgi:hypothetical protein